MKVLQYVMGIRQKLMNDYISPQMGNCGMLLKTEPSIVYPTSHVSNQKSRSKRKKWFSPFLLFQVDFNVRMNMEDVDHVHEKMHALSSHKVNVRGTLDAKAASTNESVRSWDMNVNIDMSPGHVINNLKVQMMRETPGEKNLKVRLTYLNLIILIN